MTATVTVSLNAGQVVYSSIVSPLPPNVPSENYECCATAQIGNQITPDLSAGNQLSTVKIVMSNWAYESSWVGGWGPGNANQPDPAGYTVPITVTLYNVGGDGTSVGSVLGSMTQDTLIAWRPAPAPVGNGPGECAARQDTVAWLAPNGTCYGAQASIASFDFSALNLTLPTSFIYGVSYDTETYGANPLGYAAPVDGLAVGLDTGSPSVGSNSLASTIYIDSPYETGGQAGFGATNAFGAYNVQAEFDVANAPEPGTVSLVGFGIGALALLARKARRA